MTPFVLFPDVQLSMCAFSIPPFGENGAGLLSKGRLATDRRPLLAQVQNPRVSHDVGGRMDTAAGYRPSAAEI
jgi:hypothetical protein